MEQEETDKIKGVQDLLDRITDKPSKPKGIRELHGDNLYGMEPPSWGPAASLFAQDTASRLGIDMGAPSIKTAALRRALLHPTSEDMEKLAILSPILKGGKYLAKGVGKALKGVGTAVGKGVSGFGKKSRNFFKGRKQKGIVKSQQAKATRQAEHAAKTEGMTPGRRMLSNAGFQAKEVARGTPGKVLGAGGLAWSASDAASATQKIRKPGVGGFGHG